MAADEVARFGLPPKVAFLSHSNYGSSTRKSALKMRAARDLFAAANPGIECDGEMHGDSALDPAVRSRTVLDATLTGEANVLICPNLDAANILFNVLKTTAATAPPSAPSCWVRRCSPCADPSSTVRRVVNMTALAAAQAQTRKA
jgi:malate dehydrogenase (oxaloacetate-decarboxylating)(NADP+)